MITKIADEPKSECQNHVAPEFAEAILSCANMINSPAILCFPLTADA